MGNHDPIISQYGVEQFLEEQKKMMEQIEKEKKGEIYD